MTHARTALFGFALALSACTTNPAPPMSDPSPAAAADCRAESAQSMVGSVATPANIEQARKLAGAQVARVLKPGQMVTMEYREGRLNIDVDANNVILRVRCG